MWTPPPCLSRGHWFSQQTLVFVSSTEVTQISAVNRSSQYASVFKFRELDDGSVREREHSGINQVDRDLIYWNLLQSFQIKTLAKSGVYQKTCSPRLQLKEYVWRRGCTHKNETSIDCEDQCPLERGGVHIAKCYLFNYQHMFAHYAPRVLSKRANMSCSKTGTKY